MYRQAYFGIKISKNRLVCKNALHWPIYGSCRLLVMGSCVSFLFDRPLSKLKAEEKAGWLGTWIGPQGREIYMTLQWEESEKETQ